MVVVFGALIVVAATTLCWHYYFLKKSQFLLFLATFVFSAVNGLLLLQISCRIFSCNMSFISAVTGAVAARNLVIAVFKVDSFCFVCYSSKLFSLRLDL